MPRTRRQEAAEAAASQDAAAEESLLQTQPADILDDDAQEDTDDDKEEENQGVHADDNVDKANIKEESFKVAAAAVTTLKPVAATATVVADDATVPTAIATEVLQDLVAYFGERIHADRKDRLKNLGALKYFYQQHPAHHREYGRLALCHQVAVLLSAAAARNAYGLDNVETTNDTEAAAFQSILPLKDWTAEQWRKFTKSLTELRALFLRADAATWFTTAGHANVDATVVEDRARLDCFDKVWQLLLDQLEICRTLSPMRTQLEAWLGTTPKDDKPGIADQLLVDVWHEAEEKLRPRCKSAVQFLFTDDDDVLLKPKNELLSVMTEPPFHLMDVQMRIEEILHLWSATVFGPVPSELFAKHYKISPGSSVAQIASMASHGQRESANAGRRGRQQGARRQKPKNSSPPRVPSNPELAALIKSRQLLSQSHGDDPLAEATNGLLPVGKRKAANEDDGDFMDGSDAGDGARAMISPRKRAANLFKEDNVKMLPDQGRFNEATGKAQGRHQWTDEEVQAVLAGVEVYGVGNWQQIKNSAPQALRNRSNVQIKDKWRTLKNQGFSLVDNTG